MITNSLTFKTDLFFHRKNGTVSDQQDFILIKTPKSPSFFWGNYLFFKNAPNEAAINHWPLLFQNSFKDLPVSHIAFMWDCDSNHQSVLGKAQDFINLGYELHQSTAMVCEQAHVTPPRKLNREIIVKKIELETDWLKVIDNQVAGRDPKFKAESYRKFIEQKILGYRSMIKNATTSNLGAWYGAFQDGKLVGDLGIFTNEDTARFQVVGTHPEHRRQGICSTLIYHVTQIAMTQMNAKKCVLVADPNYHARDLYQELGFIPVETIYSLLFYNPDQFIS